MFVSPGDFRVNVNAIPANAYVKSIQLGGEDVLRTGIHIDRSTIRCILLLESTGGRSVDRLLKARSVCQCDRHTIPELADLRTAPTCTEIR